MKEENQIVSPVFKKRFARRKTTHRPFTFARNFETEGTASAAQNQIINQVGDRGVVITSPVQLSKSGDGLTISDIVRQSPVPVLIAHSTPKEKQKEDSEHEDEDEANTSQLRRSFRSRKPSEQFLSRRQYPHGIPQHGNVHRAPDEHYIGSKNTSNIDAEISFADEDGQRGRRKKSTPALSSRRGDRLQTGQKAVDPEASGTGKARTRNASLLEDSRSSTKNTSTKRGSSRKGASTSAKSKSSSRKGRGQTVLDRTPSQQLSVPEHNRNRSAKTKKLAAESKSSSLSHSKKNRAGSISPSSSKYMRSATKSKTPPPSLSEGSIGKTVLRSSVSRSGDKSSKSRTKKASRSTESVPLRRVDKTPPQGKITSLSHENKDHTFSEENGDQNSSGNTKTFSQRSELKIRPQEEGGEKVMSLPSSEEISSPLPVQDKQNKTAESPSTGERTEPNSKLGSSRKRGRGNSILETSTKSSASRQADLSRSDTMMISSSAKKRRASATEESGYINASTRLSPIKENERGDMSNNTDVNGGASVSHVRTKLRRESIKSPARHRRRIISEDDADFETQSPSPEKRVRNSHLQKSERSVIQNQSVRQKSSSSSNSGSRREQTSLLLTSSSQSTRKTTRESSQPSNLSQNGKDSQLLSVHKKASGSRVGRTPQSSKPVASPKYFFSAQDRSSEKLVANETVGVKTSSRKRAASNSFWKTSRRIDTSLRPKRQKPAVSESSAYSDDSWGGTEAGSVAASQKVRRKGASHAGHDQRKSDRSSEEERPKRHHTAVTELGVVMTMLEDTEGEIIMEDYTLPGLCQSMVHKAFTFTKRQLQETESQVKQISELTYQVNKLKSVCKAMSGESKENLQQKFILQKELQSLKNRGVDADMIRIDQWLQDFEALRQYTS